MRTLCGTILAAVLSLSANANSVASFCERAKIDGGKFRQQAVGLRAYYRQFIVEFVLIFANDYGIIRFVNPLVGG